MNKSKNDVWADHQQKPMWREMILKPLPMKSIQEYLIEEEKKHAKSIF